MKALYKGELCTVLTNLNGEVRIRIDTTGEITNVPVEDVLEITLNNIQAMEEELRRLKPEKANLDEVWSEYQAELEPLAMRRKVAVNKVTEIQKNLRTAYTVLIREGVVRVLPDDIGSYSYKPVYKYEEQKLLSYLASEHPYMLSYSKQAVQELLETLTEKQRQDIGVTESLEPKIVLKKV